MRTALLFICIVLLSSCSKKVTKAVEYESPKQEVAMVLPEEPEKVEVIEELVPPVPEKEPKSITIYFKFDSYEVSESEKDKLYGLSGTVRLTGGTCDIGTDEYNYTLGLKRAYSVKEILDKYGIKVLSCTSVGKYGPDSQTDRKKNRRCIINY